jgi:hypothetical protein
MPQSCSRTPQIRNSGHATPCWIDGCGWMPRRGAREYWGLVAVFESGGIQTG